MVDLKFPGQQGHVTSGAADVGENRRGFRHYCHKFGGGVGSHQNPAVGERGEVFFRPHQYYRTCPGPPAGHISPVQQNTVALQRPGSKIKPFGMGERQRVGS